MPKTRKYRHSFSGGEISPEMVGRIDDVRHQTGVARMENFIAAPHGPAVRRPGFKHLSTSLGTNGARLVPFKYSDTQSLAIEIGDGTTDYMRFHVGGSTLEITPNDWVNDDPLDHAVRTWHGTRTVNLFSITGAYETAHFFMKDQTTAHTDINTGTDEITMTGHLFQTGDPVGMLGDSGTTYPTGSVSFNSATTYYIIYVNANTVKLAASFADAMSGTNVTFATQGNGTMWWGRADLFIDGDGVTFTGTLPAGLTVGTVYYMSRPSGFGAGGCAFELHYTREGAVNGYSTTLVDLGVSDPYPGTSYSLAWHQYFEWGKVVEYPRRGAAHYSSKQAHSTGSSWAGDTAKWLFQTGGIYTIASPFSASALFEINYAQSNDIMTLTHKDVGKYELRRWETTWWEVAEVSLTPQIDAPLGVSVTPEYGRRVVLYGIDTTYPGAVAARFYIGSGITGAETEVDDVPLATGSAIRVIGTGITIDMSSHGGSAAEPLDHVLMVADDAIGSPFEKFTCSNTYDGEVVLASEISGTLTSGWVIPMPLGEDTTNYYVVTSVDSVGNESVVSAEVSADNCLFVLGSSNTISWTGVEAANTYNVYKKRNNLFGLIGVVDASEGTSFVDDNIAPDLGLTPPIPDTTLDAEAPGVTGYFEQRRIFASTNSYRQQLWMTRSGTEGDLSYHLPLQDADRISISIASKQGESIRHVIGLDHLLVFTDHTEYRITPVNSDAITPTSLAVRPQSFVGSSFVGPLVIGRSILFCAARGGHVFETGYQAVVEGYQPGDLSLRATHLFDGLSVMDSTFSRSPFPVAWFVSSDGTLLGFTYVPEQQIGAWHKHTTPGGLIESVCAVPEGGEDRVYLVVNRSGTRHIEQMAAVFSTDPIDRTFVDRAIVYSGAKTNTITGLSHLNGVTVSILADGAVLPNQVVSSGQITLPIFASKVHVGIAYESVLETLPFLLQTDGYGQGRPKVVSHIWPRVHESGPFYMGPLDGRLVPSDNKANSITGVLRPETLTTGQVPTVIPGDWTDDAAVKITQSLPLPLTITALTLEIEVGG